VKNIALSAVFALCSIPAAFSCPAPQPDASTLFTMIEDPKTQAADVRSFLQSHAVGWDAVNEKCETTLLTAVAQNRNDLFQILFDQYKPNLNQKQPSSANSIYSYTLRTGTVETLKLVQSLGQPLNLSTVENKGVTELMVAAESNSHPEMIEYLLKNGSSAGAKDQTHQIALHYASKSNPNLSVIDALIKAHSNVNQADKSETTPLQDAAASNPNAEVINTLIKAGATVTPEIATKMLISEASRSDGNIDVMKNLIQRGASLNGVNGSVLALAIGPTTNLDVITMLIQAGASVNAVGPINGATPLIEAATEVNPQPELVQKLIDAGATVDAFNFDRETALMKIVVGNVYDDQIIKVIRELMKGGANPNINCSNTTPYGRLSILGFAKNYGAPEVVIQLLSGQTGNPAQQN